MRGISTCQNDRPIIIVSASYIPPVQIMFAELFLAFLTEAAVHYSNKLVAVSASVSVYMCMCVCVCERLGEIVRGNSIDGGRGSTQYRQYEILISLKRTYFI